MKSSNDVGGSDGAGISSKSSLSLSSPLRDVAKCMEIDLQHKIKDRTWCTKKYKQCIKNTHAIDWVMKTIVEKGKKPSSASSGDGASSGAAGVDIHQAVQLLNQLVNCGYLYHVVDPDKRFIVGDESVLYFRFARTIHRPHRKSSIALPMNLNQSNGHRIGADGRNTTATNDQNMIELMNETISKLQNDIHKLTERLDKSSTSEIETQGQLEVLKQAIIDLTTTTVTTGIQVILLYAVVAIYAIFAQTYFQYQKSAHDDEEQQYANQAGQWNHIGLVLMGCILAMILIREGHTLWSIWVRINLYLKAMQVGNDISRVEMEDEGSESSEAEDEQDDEIGDDDQVVAVPSSRSPRTTSQRRKSLLQLTQESFFQKPSRFSSILGGDSQSTTSSSRSSSDVPSSTSTAKIRMRDSHELPDVSTWPHRPVMVCANTPVSPFLSVPKYGNGPCPIGIPFEFESELFVGVCLVRLKDVTSDDVDTDNDYFDGRRRIFQTIVQGRFKEPCSVSDVLTGHEFVRPLQCLPHKWIIQTATSFIGKIAPGATINVHDDQPSVAAILGGTSQIVRGDEPGNQPDIATNFDIQEDCSVLGGIFVDKDNSSGGGDGSGISTSKRKQVLSNPKRSKHYTYDTKTIYTFDFYQNLLDCSTYSLDLGVTKIGLTKVLNGQPIQCLAKHADGRYLWSFQIWHEKLLDRKCK